VAQEILLIQEVMSGGNAGEGLIMTGSISTGMKIIK
jgi:hypothetical protein